MALLIPTVTDPVLVRAQAWLRAAVIGLNLCPFARPVDDQGRIAWRVSDAQDTATLEADLRHALTELATADPAAIDTLLVVHPHVLSDFDAYNDFLDVADACVRDQGLEGTLQIASFHPRYRFAGTAADDVENETNRAPFPMLHLLREESIARAVANHPDPDRIYQRNIETLQRLGHAGWQALARAWR